MRAPILIAVSCVATLAASEARADTFVVNAAVATTGSFACRSSLVCGGEGTNTITFGSGGESASLTFTGISSAFPVFNATRRVTLGTFSLTASDGFTFPTHPNNPGLPILTFLLFANHSLPVVTTARQTWLFGPGGGESIRLQMGRGFFSVTSGMPQYPLIVYSINPFPFTLEPNSSFTMTADVGAVPEPASMLLFGTGLAAAALGRRRRQRLAQHDR